jgi:broad specificity phosphatase PhoE
MEEIYSTTTNGKVLYIRHAPTLFNQMTISKEEGQQKRCFLDCPINDGCNDLIQQASKKLNIVNVKYVFCSPLLRCIETCYKVLSSHPDKERIRVIIHPLISEGVNGTHDFSKNMKTKRKLYNETSEVKFDWSYFDEIYPSESQGEIFFLNHVDNLNDDVIDLLNSAKISYSEEMLLQLARYYNSKKIRMETINHVFQRCLDFKNFLKEFLKNNSLQEDEKVLVFTHSAFVRLSTSQLAYSMKKVESYPEDCYHADNCEIISIDI